eukprot:gnl/MRDRNA2_/MRDRNA2_244129_c0_seq1.p1 gnl/MRDRNA2_/MRDRNA2_244129_c0~~gnl/MRDRNA2_/MRDRNA2_244129_c0_seq1.p1  ORF type:complete len:297 (+),score=65.85 gnl/MRDRNA2_/MRDRNA2_244129_c0_seq1:67-891(+)
MNVAERQSLTTHQGEEAAECCRLLAHILITAFTSSEQSAKQRKHSTLLKGLAQFSASLYSVGCLAASRAELLHAQNVNAGLGDYVMVTKTTLIVRKCEEIESEKVSKIESGELVVEEFIGARARISYPVEGWINSTSSKGEPLLQKKGWNPGVERNWNWKDPDFAYAPERMAKDPDYMGSYVMDNMAMALHCVWSTESYAEAVLKAANKRGDADTVAAVAGQMAGAIYGASAVPRAWREHLEHWDNGGVALRAWLLYHRHHDGVESSGFQITPK